MKHYCESLVSTKRFKTREVFVGSVGVGGDNPIRIQSMTTSDTRDAQKTAEQIMKLADYGCEIARVTVQGMKEAYSCEVIKSILVQKGYDIPLVADIHFFPKAAMTVADFVDKVRINPGNYVDKRASFKIIEYTEQEYQKELERLEEKFSPLVEKCQKRKISMRIGTNHGSLSDRVMNRYGDSPLGMVEAAFEYTRVCRKLGFHDIIYSMKSSNTKVMIQAYRLLVQRMMELGWNYPLHLGVTEAGNGEDGRIKSAVGTGSLLLEGLGDTIRVSLTEDPWHEIDPCKRLVALQEKYRVLKPLAPFVEKHRNPILFTKKSVNLKNTPFHPDGSALVCVSKRDLLSPTFFEDLGFEIQLAQPIKTAFSVDAIFLSETPTDPLASKALEKLRHLGVGIFSSDKEHATHPHLQIDEKTTFPLNLSNCNNSSALFVELKTNKLHFGRKVIDALKDIGCDTPVILSGHYQESLEDVCIHFGAELGSLLCDGLADGVMLNASDIPLKKRRELAFNLLQASRMRSSKTEFISCPSCGRTLFDLQEVTAKIQEKTAHLPGVKIAIMGCIVNGPGEMADADFGYVGSKPGKIDLYVGKKCVQRDIDDEDAVESLIELLKKHNKWVEPKNLENLATTL